MFVMSLIIVIMKDGGGGNNFTCLLLISDVGASSNAYGAAILTGLLRMAGTFGGTLLLMRGIPRKVNLQLIIFRE